MPARVRAVLFDFNGTLSDDEPVLCAIYRELFAEHGKPLGNDEYYARLAGLSEETIIGGWLGVEGPDLDLLVAERIERYRRAVTDGRTVAASIRDAVRYAAAHVPIGLVSGAFRAEIEPVLEAAGIASHFSVLVTAEDVPDGKPHPGAYLRALELLGGPDARHVVALEDTVAGIAAAKAAGLVVLGVLGTVSPERLAQADALVERIDLGLLQQLLRCR